MNDRPKYAETPGTLDLAIVIGNSFGPMRCTPSTDDPTAGRTYSASAYTRAGVKLADFSVVISDAARGILELSMTLTESAKLTAGILVWDCSYIATGIKKTVFSGNLEARIR